MTVIELTINEKLDRICENVYVSIHYSLDDTSDRRMYGLVTTREDLINTDTIPPMSMNTDHVLWDVVTNSWLVLSHSQIKKIKFDFLDTLGYPQPEELIEHDGTGLEEYNAFLLSRVTSTVERFDELVGSIDIQLTDEERDRYKTLFFRPDLTGEQMALCVVFEIENIDDLHNKDVSSVKTVWLDLIRRYRNTALMFLDSELEGEGDSETVQEIEAVKQLLRDIPQDNTLNEFNTIDEVISFWPVLLLPAPDFVCRLQHITTSK